VIGTQSYQLHHFSSCKWVVLLLLGHMQDQCGLLGNHRHSNRKCRSPFHFASGRTRDRAASEKPGSVPSIAFDRTFCLTRLVGFGWTFKEWFILTWGRAIILTAATFITFQRFILANPNGLGFLITGEGVEDVTTDNHFVGILQLCVYRVGTVDIFKGCFSGTNVITASTFIQSRSRVGFDAKRFAFYLSSDWMVACAADLDTFYKTGIFLVRTGDASPIGQVSQKARAVIVSGCRAQEE
jgi:hypothetical protein